MVTWASRTPEPLKQAPPRVSPRRRIAPNQRDGLREVVRVQVPQAGDVGLYGLRCLPELRKGREMTGDA
jgi:hypothetical protein